MSLNDALDAARQLSDVLDKIQRQLEEINQETGAASSDDAGEKLLALRVSANELYFITRKLAANLKRFGLSEDVNTSLNLIQRMITSIRLLQLAIQHLTVTAGPLGWALFAVSAMSGVMIWSDVGQGYRR